MFKETCAGCELRRIRRNRTNSAGCAPIFHFKTSWRMLRRLRISLNARANSFPWKKRCERGRYARKGNAERNLNSGQQCGRTSESRGDTGERDSFRGEKAPFFYARGIDRARFLSHIGVLDCFNSRRGKGVTTGQSARKRSSDEDAI